MTSAIGDKTTTGLTIVAVCHACGLSYVTMPKAGRPCLRCGIVVIPKGFEDRAATDRVGNGSAEEGRGA